MKIIDLLNNISDEKFRPLKIEFDGKIYQFDCGVYYDEDGEELLKGYKLNYYVLNKGIEIIEEENKLLKETTRLYSGYDREKAIRDEYNFINGFIVEEDKKIEKLDIEKMYTVYNHAQKMVVDKLNEIIDKINKEEE